MKTAASRVTFLARSASAPEAAPTPSQHIVGGSNELLDRMTNGLIMCQAMDDPVKPNIHGSRPQSWNFPLKRSVDSGMRF